MNWIIAMMVAAQQVTVPVQPAGDFRLTVADYPPEAMKRGEAGTVEASLAIDAAGAVAGCTIAKSSGSELLDARTCELLQQRARYAPARDAAGSAVPSTKMQRVSWVLPGKPDPVTGRIDGEALLDFDRDGMVNSCQVLTPTGDAKTDARICRIIAGKTQDQKRTDSRGRRIAHQMVVPFSFNETD